MLFLVNARICVVTDGPLAMHGGSVGSSSAGHLPVPAIAALTQAQMIAQLRRQIAHSQRQAHNSYGLCLAVAARSSSAASATATRAAVAAAEAQTLAIDVLDLPEEHPAKQSAQATLSAVLLAVEGAHGDVALAAAETAAAAARYRAFADGSDNGEPCQVQP